MIHRILCVSLMIFSISPSHAKTTEVNEKEKLGEIKYMIDLPEKWQVVVGEKDSFLISKNGRFSISSINGRFQITDLWREEAITAKELSERFEEYPIDLLSKKAKSKPLRLGDPNKPAGLSVFLILNDRLSINFYKDSEATLKKNGADIYVIPGSDYKKYYGFECSSFERRLEILKGLDITSDFSKCDTAILNGRGTSTLAVTKLLGIKRAPFVINNRTFRGRIVDSKTLGEALKND